jgi:hypothetical protein
MKKILNKIKLFAKWVLNKLKKRYEITVSFNKEYGDADDRIYITKRILVQKEKHLKFINENNKLIEYRSSGGLNYIIKRI